MIFVLIATVATILYIVNFTVVSKRLERVEGGFILLFIFAMAITAGALIAVASAAL